MKSNKTYLLLVLFAFTSIFSQAQWGSVTALLEQGTLDKAKEALNKAWEKVKAKEEAGKLKNPNKTWSDANFYKGEVYSRIANDPTPTKIYLKSDPEAVFIAYEAYQKAIELDKDGKGKGEASKKVLFKLWAPGVNYGVKQFETANTLEGEERKQGFKKSMQAFNIGRLVNKEDTLATIYTAEMAYAAQEYEVYEEAIAEVLELDIKDKTRYLLSRVFYLRDVKQDSEAALKATTEGLEKGNAETSPQDYATLGKLQTELMQKLGKTGDAIRKLEAEVKANPDDATNYLRLGAIYQGMGEKNAGNAEMAIKAENEEEAKKETEEKMVNYQKAEKLFLKALEIESDNFIGLKGLAILYFNHGNDIAKEIGRWDVTTYNKKGREAEKLRKDYFSKAKPYFNKMMNHKDYVKNTTLEDAYKILEETLNK